MMYLRTVCVTSVLAHCTVIHSEYKNANSNFNVSDEILSGSNTIFTFITA